MTHKWVAAGAFFGSVLLFSVSMQAQSGGAKIFQAQCAQCHGADGGANTTMGKSLSMRDLRSADVQKRSDADLTSIITSGMGVMPQHGTNVMGIPPEHKYQLTKDEIRQVIAYIRQIAKK